METTDDIYAAIEIKSANRWMREARQKPVPKMLFGELWLEGELAVLFGDTGVGKSILATAIAESIARGHPVGPFEFTTKPQKVLYIDFDLSSKQFEMRYSADHEPEKGEFLRKPYRFSERFQRIELKAEMLPKAQNGGFEDELRRMLKELVERAGARVLIIDNISHLKRTADDARGWATVLKELKCLKDETGISILVLANTLKRSAWRPILAGDVQGPRAVASYADNIFAIGSCRADASLRYIKHVRPRSSELIFGTEHVPAFRIAKCNGNFLSFEFRGFASEVGLLRHTCDTHDWQTIEKVKRLSDAGMSIRQIAAELNISKSAAHRYLHMPLAEETHFAEDIAEEKTTVKKAWNYFPGREEFQAAGDDPRFDHIYDREDEATYALRREAYLIELATANARTQYIETGHAPTFAEAWAEVRHHMVSADTPASSDVYDDDEQPPDSIEAFNSPPENRTTQAETNASHAEPNAPNIFGTQATLKPSRDGYDREIFVESEDEHTGKPTIWYQTDPKGNKFCFKRNGNGVSRVQLIE